MSVGATAVTFVCMGRGSLKAGWVAMALAGLGLLAPAVASGASSGEITRAEVNPDWTSASIAGVAVRSNDCVVPPKDPDGPQPPKEPETTISPDSPPWACGWIPFATIGPGSSSADCSASGRRLNSIGEDVQLAWVGPELQGPGVAPFDLAALSLARGSAGPLLCLSAVEAVYARKVCVPEIDCSGYWIVHQVHQLHSALLGVVSPTPLSPPPLGAPAPPPPSPPRCRTPKPRPKAAKRKARIGIGPSIRVTGSAKPVRRCKRG